MSHPEIGQATQPAFRRASFCAANECVEIGQQHDMIIVRDAGQKPPEVLLHFAAADWSSFARSIKRGRFDGLRP